MEPRVCAACDDLIEGPEDVGIHLPDGGVACVGCAEYVDGLVEPGKEDECSC